MRKFLLLIAMVFAINTGFAQDYDWAVGVRAGGTNSGLTVKHKMNSSSAVEGVLSIPYDAGFIFTGLYEVYMPVIGDGFNLYYGGGAHVGVLGNVDRFRLGIDGVVGLEYKIPEVPIAFSLEYKPALDIISHTQFHYTDFALGIKFAF